MRRTIWSALFVACILLIWAGVPVCAQIPLTGAGRGAPGGGGNVFASYTNTDNPAAQPSPGTSAVTFAGANIGAAAANRVVVLVYSSSVAATSATVGGVSMTKAVEESSLASGLQIWYGTVPTGTTANVVMTSPSTQAACVLAVGAFNSGASTTPANTQSAASASSTTQTLNTTIPSSGFAVMGTYNQSATQTPTWTNMTASGGDTSRNTGTGDELFTAHSTTAGSPTALSISISGGAAQIHSVSASWGP